MISGTLGGAFSRRTHADKSKIMNANAFSCGDSSLVMQPPGKGVKWSSLALPCWQLR
jgi:hypothetical protein